MTKLSNMEECDHEDEGYSFNEDKRFALLSDKLDPNYRQGMINWDFRGPVVKWMPGEIVCVWYILAVGGNMWTSSIAGPRRLDVLQLRFVIRRGLKELSWPPANGPIEDNPVPSSVGVELDLTGNSNINPGACFETSASEELNSPTSVIVGRTQFIRIPFSIIINSSLLFS